MAVSVLQEKQSTMSIFVYPDTVHAMEVQEERRELSKRELLDTILENRRTFSLRDEVLTRQDHTQDATIEKLAHPLPEEVDVYCQGYAHYLKMCWDLDLGYEVAPWYIWNVIVWRLANFVNQDPEHFRCLFTQRKEKVMIRMDTTEFDAAQYVEVLHSLLPTDAQAWFPEWEHAPAGYRDAMCTLFAEATRDYYGCVIWGCGIPAVRVVGSPEEWQRLLGALDALPGLIRDLGYTKIAREVVEQMIANLSDPEYWKYQFFRGQRCGSGSQVEYCGDLVRLLDVDMCVNNVLSTLGKFQFEDVRLREVYGPGGVPETHIGPNAAGVVCKHVSGIIGAKIDAQGIAVPKYDTLTVVPKSRSELLLPLEQYRRSVLTYRWHRNTEIIKKNNNRMRVKHKLWEMCYEERWSKCLKHRSNRARKAEAALVNMLPTVHTTFGLKMIFNIVLSDCADLKSVRLNLALRELLSSVPNGHHYIRNGQRVYKIGTGEYILDNFLKVPQEGIEADELYTERYWHAVRAVHSRNGT